MSDTLYNIYKDTIGDDVEKVYVLPRIERSSTYNPYLKNLYDQVNEIPVESINPIFPIFILKKIKGEKSVLHYHWLEFCNFKEFLILTYKLLLLITYLLFGGKIVWTMHNLTPHCKKYKKINFFIRKWMTSVANYIILHSEKAKPAVISYYRIPVKKIRIIPHPTYNVILRDKHESIDRINSLYNIHIDKIKPLFLMYGRIAQYKGILEIIKIFIKNEYQIIIAGDTAKESYDYANIIKELSSKTKNIFFINKFIPHNEESFIFGASDITIFNFTKMLSSGSILLADSYGKEIIAPLSAKSLLNNNSVMTFSNHDELSKIIENANRKYLKSE